MIKEIIDLVVWFLLVAGTSNLIVSFFTHDWFHLISGTIYLIISIKAIIEIQKSK